MQTRRLLTILFLLSSLATCSGEPEPAADATNASAGQPGATMGIYSPTQHPLYDGHFIMSGSRVYQVGSLTDAPPWDHMGDDGTNVQLVPGSVDVDVDERANTGTFRAELDVPEGRYVLEMDRFEEFSPCHDGGIAAWLFEHGDSGCGDANWPKSIL